jgi:hypothetical protein
MSDSYYVRSQGKVVGPYSFEDLKAKAGKGHLKKTHQVSTDKKTWQAARRVEGLFPPLPKLPPRSAREPEAPALGEPELVEVTLIEEEPLEIPAPEDQTEWHYCLQGDEQTQGPVSETKLRRLFQSGRLPLDTLVWNETLSDWVEATRIPALHAAPVPGAGPVVSAEVPLFDAQSDFPPAEGEDLPVPPLASASLILGILGIAIPIGVASVLAIVFGHLALSQIQANRPYFQGEGMAKTGLILGYIVLTILLLGGSAWLILHLARS